jgi:predicted Rossmann fold flavoprotein
MMYDAMIIGGGASGLAAACALAGAGKKVLLAEKQSRVGRKLLSTGNGRCNLTNLRAVPQNYHGARAAAARALALCPPKDVLDFFEELGLPAVSDEEGRVYPMSNQAASVLDALRLSAAERGCEIITDCAVEAVQRGKNGFSVRCSEGRSFQAKKVLVCTGGLAAPKLGACGDGYRILESLGHSSTPKFPAIAALRTPPEAVRALKGQRAECEIVLTDGERTLRAERGEILCE